MDEKLQNAIKGCLNHDRRAQKALYDLCFSPLMAICLRYQKNREDAVALLNEAFLKILTHLHLFDASKPFLTWAGTITVRTAIDLHRKNIKTQHDYLDDQHTPEQDIIAVAGSLNLEEILEIVQQLPISERLVFNLFEMEGFAHQEIALQLNISERSSKRLLHNAKIRLKQWILNQQFVLF